MTESTVQHMSNLTVTVHCTVLKKGGGDSKQNFGDTVWKNAGEKKKERGGAPRWVNCTVS